MYFINVHVYRTARLNLSCVKIVAAAAVMVMNKHNRLEATTRNKCLGREVSNFGKVRQIVIQYFRLFP